MTNGMLYNSAASKGVAEREMREFRSKSRMLFGVDFLDDALMGILPDDLVIVGARSGAGKTQLCCNIARANMNLGRKVYYIALEASRFEIESRLKFPMVMGEFYRDPNRPSLGNKVSFGSWMSGNHIRELAEYEERAEERFKKEFRNLVTVYREEKFDVDDLIEHTYGMAKKADLILIDHLHYFDYHDGEQEYSALRKIAKTVRSMSLDQMKPIVLVAHLRKPDRFNDDLVPDMYEIHGASDIYKIATKIVTLAPGGMTHDNCYETYFRIPKGRFFGDAARYIGKSIYSPRWGGYEKGYKITGSNAKRGDEFEPLADDTIPAWAEHCTRSGRNSHPLPAPKRAPNAFTRRPGVYVPGD